MHVSKVSCFFPVRRGPSPPVKLLPETGRNPKPPAGWNPTHPPRPAQNLATRIVSRPLGGATPPERTVAPNWVSGARRRPKPRPRRRAPPRSRPGPYRRGCRPPASAATQPWLVVVGPQDVARTSRRRATRSGRTTSCRRWRPSTAPTSRTCGRTLADG